MLVPYDYLIVERCKRVSDAISEIDGLNEDEVKGICQGFQRGEIFGLNSGQIRALVLSGDKGVTANHLRGCDWFGENHAIALKKLITKREMTIEAAMLEIDELTESEAQYIARGLSRNEVIVLSTHQSEALVRFRDKGLTVDYLSRCSWFDSEHHVNALRVLFAREVGIYVPQISDTIFRPMKLDMAILELEGLTGDEAFAICRGFSRSEIDRLSRAQIKELVKFKDTRKSDYHYRALIAELHMAAKYAPIKIDSSMIIESDIVEEVSSCDLKEKPNNGYIICESAPDGGYACVSFGVAGVRLLREDLVFVGDILLPAVCELLVTRDFYSHLVRNGCISNRVTAVHIKDNLRGFATDLLVMQGYVSYMFNVANREDWQIHPCVLQALAHIEHVELRIWRLGNDAVLIPHKSENHDYSVYTPPEALERIDLLFLDDKSFKRLKFVGYENDEIPDELICPFGSPEDIQDNSANKLGMGL